MTQPGIEPRTISKHSIHKANGPVKKKEQFRLIQVLMRYECEMSFLLYKNS